MSRKRLKASTLVEALLGGDRDAASSLSRKALGECGSRANLVSDYMQPALFAISELWYQGTVRAFLERDASETVVAILRQLEPTPALRPVAPGSRILLSGLEGDQHVLGIATLSELLRDEGWDVEELRQEHFVDLVDAAAVTRPHVVGISCGYLPDPHRLGGTIAALKDLKTQVMIGGPAINRAPSLWSRLGADATGLDARVTIVAARQQLSRYHRRVQLEDLYRTSTARAHRRRRARSTTTLLRSVGPPLRPAS
jgi:methanogenic corrinoid protein MtbC1